MPRATDSVSADPDHTHPETRLESVEDIRQAVDAKRAATLKEAAVDGDTIAYRPVHRPPMGMLCVLHDGRDDGEWVPLRKDKVVLGRSEGDVVISHDGMMSGRHAEISREVVKGGYRWFLTDLQSRNGTFVRVADTPIQHGQEFLLGSRRFRFNAAPQGAALLAEPASTDSSQPQTTRGWQAVSPNELIPSLIEITPQGEGQRFLLKGADVWIGRDAKQCSVVIPDDLMVSPRHARLHRDPRGQWHLENAGSRNGTWVRINRQPLLTNGQFQLGEQRFFVRILS